MSFDLSKMQKYPVICLLGKRRSGKTWAIRDIVYNHFHKQRKYKFVILVSPTARLNEDYAFIPDDFKFEEFSETLLMSLMKRQADLLKKDKKSAIDTLLILDDVVNLADKSQAGILSSLLVKSRHYRISIILSLQYMKAREFPPASRDNLDYIFVFPQNNKENIRNIVDQWLGGNKEKEEQGYRLVYEVPDYITHRVLVISNTESTHDLRSITSSYIAQKIPTNFRIKQY